MFALQAKPIHHSGGLASTYETGAVTMSRVPIAALLRQDTASVVDRFSEQGRTYYKFKNDMYLFPADDVEFERLDVMHSLIYRVALNNQLHVAMMRTTPRRILDIGFGTGFWMLDMESRYPSAEVIGLDMEAPPQGVKSTQRLNFRSPVDFTAPQWPVEESSVDFVHMAQLVGCVPNWLDQYGKAYRCLRPGSGQIEHVEIDWTPRSYQPNFPANATDLWNWWGWMLQASDRAGKSLAYREDTEELLEQAGFVDVSHKRVRVPLCGTDRRDLQEKQLAHGYQMTMGYTGSQSFTGMSMALFTRYLGMSPHHVEQLCARVLAVVQQESLPLYINLHVWTARRPMS
ncbi:uncharacterized protein RCC_03341 [Ramularia collo-cygni]|uniref:Methyltransferase n=1 Tax=Ramularia collo-cygni TaxID=112498 RepID=A0A2D3UYS4_9PEZI|nr:uncharacterized protein RCC_03341 [Ramularia collo-cygni]CZT17507.1 uncharacterized protein RCC_03341 [Ramularia collo-cygni]